MTGNTPISDEALRHDLLIALCTDHGHLNQAGSLSCKTCNRRVATILGVVAEHSAAPLLVSAEADRLARERDEAERYGIQLTRDVEGLRAELAEREARVDRLESALVSERAATEMWRSTALTVDAARAALRAAGGQDCTGLTARWCPMHGTCSCPATVTLFGETQSHNGEGCALHSVGSAHAAPVGGQAEPSDAQIDAGARALNRRIGGLAADMSVATADEQATSMRSAARDILRAAAAASGEQATPPSGEQR